MHLAKGAQWSAHGKGAGCVCTMTRNGQVLLETGRRVGTHKTKLNEGVGYDC